VAACKLVANPREFHPGRAVMFAGAAPLAQKKSTQHVIRPSAHPRRSLIGDGLCSRLRYSLKSWYIRRTWKQGRTWIQAARLAGRDGCVELKQIMQQHDDTGGWKGVQTRAARLMVQAGRDIAQERARYGRLK